MYHIKMTNPAGDAVLLMTVTTVKDRPKAFRWTYKADEAMKMEADKAITYHSEIVALYGAQGVLFTIEPAAKCLAQQLDKNGVYCVASLVGANPESRTFESNLQKTPALPYGFSIREAAIAYIDTARAGLVAARPEVRT